MDKTTLEMVFKLVITLIFFLVSTYLIPWLKSKIGEAKLNDIQKYAEWAVRSAEQLYTAEEWEEKKIYAMNYMAEKISETGIELTVADINALVEATVNLIKYGTEYSK